MLPRLALVSLLALTAACGSTGGNVDAPLGHPDYVFPDVVIDGGMVIPDASDVVRDVAPVVDVLYFDVPAAVDASAPGDAAAAADADSACESIAESYASAVHDAETCSVGTDCSVSVCETLCCDCNVYVNASASAFAMITTQQALWRSMHCDETTECPPIECTAATAATCSSEGRCITLRGGDS